MIGETRPLHLSSGKQVNPRQNIGRDEHQQTNARESEDGPEFRSTPALALTLQDRRSMAPDCCFQQRDGDCKTNKI